MEEESVQEPAKAPPSKRAMAASGEPATNGRSRSLWFNAPTDDQDRRPQLTRERVVAEALAVIAADGAQALTMRGLAARLGVVPGALYRRVRDAATRAQLHAFFRSLPPDRFPALVALGEHVWLDNREERFTAGLEVLVDGLEQARRSPHRRALGAAPTTTTATTRRRQRTQQAADGDTQRRGTR